ncbi:hypothetical protein [Bremerella volcania]|uniref:hypothetical protein n=1 Tax=Bremerella volcania TaxID=2527984 RepID=UPI0011A044CA|nr:hypothetical protein [Bremerella volcania]
MPRKSKQHWTTNVVPWGTNEIVRKHPHREKSAKERDQLATSLMKEAYVFHFRAHQAERNDSHESQQQESA